MTYLAKPKLHHPELPKNALGYTRRDYEGAVSTLCAGCGHDSISAAIVRAYFNLDLPSHRKAVRYRVLVEDADVRPRRLARLQLCAWTHAVGADRCQPGKSRPDLPGRVRRWRQRFHRHRPVRPCHAAWR